MSNDRLSRTTNKREGKMIFNPLKKTEEDLNLTVCFFRILRTYSKHTLIGSICCESVTTLYFNYILFLNLKELPRAMVMVGVRSSKTGIIEEIPWSWRRMSPEWEPGTGAHIKLWSENHIWKLMQMTMVTKFYFLAMLD